MVDLNRKITAEKQNIDQALINLKDAMSRAKKTNIELAAIATFLHNISVLLERFFIELKKGRVN